MLLEEISFFLCYQLCTQKPLYISCRTFSLLVNVHVTLPQGGHQLAVGPSSDLFSVITKTLQVMSTWSLPQVFNIFPNSASRGSNSAEFSESKIAQLDLRELSVNL